MQAARLQRMRASSTLRVRGAADVRRAVALRGRRHVVDRGERWDEAAPPAPAAPPDAPPRPPAAAGADPRAPARRALPQTVRTAAPQRADQLIEAPQRPLAHEHVSDLALAVREQQLHEATPDEPRGAGDEVGHGPASIEGGAAGSKAGEPGPSSVRAGGAAGRAGEPGPSSVRVGVAQRRPEAGEPGPSSVRAGWRSRSKAGWPKREPAPEARVSRLRSGPLFDQTDCQVDRPRS